MSSATLCGADRAGGSRGPEAPSPWAGPPSPHPRAACPSQSFPRKQKQGPAGLTFCMGRPEEGPPRGTVPRVRSVSPIALGAGAGTDTHLLQAGITFCWGVTAVRHRPVGFWAPESRALSSATDHVARIDLISRLVHSIAFYQPPMFPCRWLSPHMLPSGQEVVSVEAEGQA